MERDDKMKEKIREDKKKEPKVGEGFNDARGYIPEGPITKNNGLNINNEPQGAEQRDKEKDKRR